MVGVEEEAEEAQEEATAPSSEVATEADFPVTTTDPSDPASVSIFLLI